MPDHRKPPVTSTRPEAAKPARDSLDFSIETTTMRLRSLKLRREAAADRELDDQLRALSPQAAKPAVKSEWDRDEGPAGRVRHDERGRAVWDWAVATGEFATLSATNVMAKLDVSKLRIEETQRAIQQMKAPARDAGGGGDPYNQRKDSDASAYNPYDPHSKAPPPAHPSGDPYNTRGGTPRAAAGTIKRPAPPVAPAKKPGSSVLDQLLGKKK